MRARPTNAEEVAEAVRAHPAVAARGGGTKPSLLGAGEVIEMGGVTGITEYEAAEYTFTAKAGTPLKEVEEALRAKGQYLPFDPLFGEGGATLGGTIAAGISGPGRFRYGGLRDFLIGVQFVDGHGELVRSGGKVVKNAAGFDLPKFLVGSLGRFGILTEVSFKVFPAPVCTTTLCVDCDTNAVAVERLARVASSRWEADALEYDARERELWIRLGGPEEALDLLCGEIEREWPGEVRRIESATASRFWSALRQLTPIGEGVSVVRVVLTPSRIVGLEDRLSGLGGGGGRWYSMGGAAGWFGVDAGRLGEWSAALEEEGLTGLVVFGEAGEGPLVGRRASSTIVGAVKKALDPVGRFAEY